MVRRQHFVCYFVFVLVQVLSRALLCESACQSCLMQTALLPRRPRFDSVTASAASAVTRKPQWALATALSGLASLGGGPRSSFLRKSVVGTIVGVVAVRGVLDIQRKRSIFRNDPDDEATQPEKETLKEEETKPPLTSAMVATIGVYKNFISPLLPPACRFLPTCSQYGVQAIEEFGPAKGAILTAWRLLRCSPFGGKGYDPPRWPPVEYAYGSY